MAEKATALVLDFTNVKERGDYNPVLQEPGDYLMKIKAVSAQESKAGNTMWVFSFAPVSTDPKLRNATYPYYCVIDEKSLWKVRNVFASAGISVAKSRMRVDPNRVVGRTIGVTLDTEEYEGKERSKVVGVMPVEELDQTETEPTDPNDSDGWPEEPGDADVPDSTAVSDDEMESLNL